MKTAMYVNIHQHVPNLTNVISQEYHTDSIYGNNHLIHSLPGI